MRQLADLARSSAVAAPASARSEPERRFVRFNDAFRTMSVQLPALSYAETRGAASRPGRARSPPTARPPGTSASATPSWS